MNVPPPAVVRNLAHRIAAVDPQSQVARLIRAEIATPALRLAVDVELARLSGFARAVSDSHRARGHLRLVK